jgi:hypothetical protein
MDKHSSCITISTRVAGNNHVINQANNWERN